MNKKPIKIESISNELAGASLFFASRDPSPTPPSVPDEQILVPAPVDTPQPIGFDVGKEENHASKHDNINPDLHADMKAGELDSQSLQKPYDPIETIRKTVRQLGKEPLFIRLTSAEKERVATTIYAINGLYHREGNNKFTANELVRIAINFLLEDFQENRESSSLAKILEALKA